MAYVSGLRQRGIMHHCLPRLRGQPTERGNFSYQVNETSCRRLLGAVAPDAVLRKEIEDDVVSLKRRSLPLE